MWYALSHASWKRKKCWTERNNVCVCQLCVSRQHYCSQHIYVCTTKRISLKPKWKWNDVFCVISLNGFFSNNLRGRFNCIFVLCRGGCVYQPWLDRVGEEEKNEEEQERSHRVPQQRKSCRSVHAPLQIWDSLPVIVLRRCTKVRLHRWFSLFWTTANKIWSDLPDKRRQLSTLAHNNTNVEVTEWRVSPSQVCCVELFIN